MSLSNDEMHEIDTPRTFSRNHTRRLVRLAVHEQLEPEKALGFVGKQLYACDGDELTSDQKQLIVDALREIQKTLEET